MHDLNQKVKELGPWYHKIALADGVYTKPEGFNPESKWRVLSANLPEDLAGKTVLEIGCSSAYYSVKMAQRGATCYAFDHFERAVRQAQFLAAHFDVNIDATVASVYDIDRFNVRHYDYVLFLGVLYHLRYPLLALDMIGDLDYDEMFLQTITYEDHTMGREYTEYLENQKAPAFSNEDFPTLKFIEHMIRSDATSWYNYNSSAVEAMLRSAGMTGVARISNEYWRCSKGTRPTNADIEYHDLLRGLKSGGELLSDGKYYVKLHDRFQSLENKLAQLQRENEQLRTMGQTTDTGFSA